MLRIVTQRLAVGETFKNLMNCRYSQNDSDSKSPDILLATSKYFPVDSVLLKAYHEGTSVVKRFGKIPSDNRFFYLNICHATHDKRA